MEEEKELNNPAPVKSSSLQMKDNGTVDATSRTLTEKHSSRKDDPRQLSKKLVG